MTQNMTSTETRIELTEETGHLDTRPCVVGCHPHGITLNPLEFLLDEEEPEKLKVFPTRDHAVRHLMDHGVTLAEMEGLRFFLEENGEPGQELD